MDTEPVDKLKKTVDYCSASVAMSVREEFVETLYSFAGLISHRLDHVGLSYRFNVDRSLEFQHTEGEEEFLLNISFRDGLDQYNLNKLFSDLVSQMRSEDLASDVTVTVNSKLSELLVKVYCVWKEEEKKLSRDEKISELASLMVKRSANLWVDVSSRAEELGFEEKEYVDMVQNFQEAVDESCPTVRSAEQFICGWLSAADFEI